jgi:hypothetical protein
LGHLFECGHGSLELSGVPWHSRGVSVDVFKHQPDPHIVVVDTAQRRHVGIGWELTDHMGFGSVHARAPLILDGADRLDKSATPVSGHHPLGSTGRETARLGNGSDYRPATDDGFDASPNMRRNLRPGDPHTRSNRTHLLMLADRDVRLGKLVLQTVSESG